MQRATLETQLAAMPLFEGLTPRQLAEVAGTILDRDVKAGKPVIKAGNWGHEFLIVLEGEMEIWRDGRVVDTLGPGGHVGELAVISDARRNATVIAKTPVVIGAIEAGLFRALIDDMPIIAERIAANVSQYPPSAG